MEPIKMGKWRAFLDSLDTGGGHIFLVFCLVPIGAALFYFDATAGGQIMTGALSALYVMLRSKGTNREQMEPSPQTTAAVVSTTTSVPATPAVPLPAAPETP